MSFVSLLGALAAAPLHASAQVSGEPPPPEPVEQAAPAEATAAEVSVEPSVAVPAAEATASGEAPAPASAPEELRVTIMGTPLARTPGSAHVVRGSQLERFKHDDPHAVLTGVPGVYVRGEDGFGLRPNIGIRGVDPDRSKKVTLLEDGVLFGPAPYSAPAAYYFPLMARMTQVRVIKGPGAIAYGPQTIGGAVDFITRPIPTSTSGGFDLAGGQYGYRKAHGYFGTSDGQTGFLAEGLHLSSEGFKELPGAADTGFYRNDWMVKGSHVIDPDAEILNELRVKLTYSDEVSNESYLGLTDEDFRQDPLQRYPVSALDRMRNYRTSIVATHVLEPSDDVKLTTDVYRHDYYRIWRKVNRFDDAQLYDVLTQPSAVHDEYVQVLRGASDSLPSQTLWIGPNEREFVSQGVASRLRWDAETGPIAHRMEYGLLFHNDRIGRRHSEDQFDVVEGVPRPTLLTDVTTFNEDWTYAIAAHAANAMTWRGLSVTPGLRFELIRSGAENLIPDPDTDQLLAEQTRWTSVLLPGLGLYYALTEQLGVLAGVYRGFSPPAPGSEPDIEPELSWNYEAGARYSRGASRAEVIGFYNDYQNLTSTCTFSSGCRDQQLDMQFDAGRARIYGFEAYVDSDIPLSSALKLPVSAAYTLTQTEFLQSFESQNPIWGQVERGDEIPYVPEHQVSASLGLEHERAGGNVSATYVAAMLEQDQPTRLETDEQLTFDVALYYRALEALELYAIGHNIFDSDFIVSRRPYGARPNAPLTVIVGVKAEL